MSKSYEVIFENNQQWLETKKQQHPEYFTELADGQNPDFLYWMLRQPRGCRGSDGSGTGRSVRSPQRR